MVYTPRGCVRLTPRNFSPFYHLYFITSKVFFYLHPWYPYGKNTVSLRPCPSKPCSRYHKHAVGASDARTIRFTERSKRSGFTCLAADKPACGGQNRF